MSINHIKKNFIKKSPLTLFPKCLFLSDKILICVFLYPPDKIFAGAMVISKKDSGQKTQCSIYVQDLVFIDFFFCSE